MKDDLVAIRTLQHANMLFQDRVGMLRKEAESKPFQPDGPFSRLCDALLELMAVNVRYTDEVANKFELAIKRDAEHREAEAREPYTVITVDSQSALAAALRGNTIEDDRKLASGTGKLPGGGVPGDGAPLGRPGPLPYGWEQAYVAIGEYAKTMGSDGNWNTDSYQLGYFNGIELCLATIEGRAPAFRTLPPVTKPKGSDAALPGISLGTMSDPVHDVRGEKAAAREVLGTVEQTAEPEANLGLATNGEMLDEIAARLRIHRSDAEYPEGLVKLLRNTLDHDDFLDYRTVSEDGVDSLVEFCVGVLRARGLHD